jgi:hypothetical protein
MSQTTKLAAIISRFTDNFALTPIAHKNRKFDVNPAQDWVKLVVNFGDEVQASMGDPGNNYFRQLGVIFVQIYVRPHRGTEDMTTYTDAVNSIWRGAQFGGIVCSAPDTNDLGLVGDWYQVNVSCEFYYDELH